MASRPENLSDGWEWDDSGTVPTGMSVRAELEDGSTVGGELAALWTFRGRAAAGRDRRSGRRRRRAAGDARTARRPRGSGQPRRMILTEITGGFKTHPKESDKQQAKLTDEPSEKPRGPSTTVSWQAGRRRLLRTRGFSGTWQKSFVRSGDSALRVGVTQRRVTTSSRVPAARYRDHHEFSMTATSYDSPNREFIFSNERLKVQEGGAKAPPTAGVAGRYLPIRQAKPEHSSGGGARGPPPASQHVAVRGGGVTPPLTASCCEAGAGGTVGGGPDA